MHFFSLVFTFLLLEEEWQRRLEKKRSIMNKKGSQVSTPVRAEQSKAKQSRTMLKFELLMFESRNRLTLTYPAYAPTSWVIVHTQHMRHQLDNRTQPLHGCSNQFGFPHKTRGVCKVSKHLPRLTYFKSFQFQPSKLVLIY